MPSTSTSLTAAPASTYVAGLRPLPRVAGALRAVRPPAVAVAVAARRPCCGRGRPGGGGASSVRRRRRPRRRRRRRAGPAVADLRLRGARPVRGRRVADPGPARRCGSASPASSRASSPRSSAVSPRSAAASVQSSPRPPTRGGIVVVAVVASAPRPSSPSASGAGVGAVRPRSGREPAGLLAAAAAARAAPAPLLGRAVRGRLRRAVRRGLAPSASRCSVAVGAPASVGVSRRGGFGSSARCRRGDSVVVPVSSGRSNSDIDAFSHDACASSARGRVSASSGSNRVPSRSIHWWVRSARASTSPPGRPVARAIAARTSPGFGTAWLRVQFHLDAHRIRRRGRSHSTG